jgi:hypothetical protein
MTIFNSSIVALTRCFSTTMTISATTTAGITSRLPS